MRSNLDATGAAHAVSLEYLDGLYSYALMLTLNPSSKPRRTAPMVHADNSAQREQVRAAIQKLPLELREVLLLREYAGLSCQEIAAIFERPSAEIVSHLATARAKLRTLLQR